MARRARPPRQRSLRSEKAIPLAPFSILNQVCALLVELICSVPNLLYTPSSLTVLDTVADTALILLVEDQQDDILLVTRAFKVAGIANPIQVVRSGTEALSYLSGEGKFANRAEYPLPRIVLLDLRMPGMDGYEVLTWVRKQDGLRGLPVIVLTSSNLISDVNRAYQLGATSFFVKDVDFQNTISLVQALKTYWMDLALTPENRRPKRKHAHE